MASLEKIKQRVSEIANNPKNVSSSDIEWVVGQLSQNGYRTSERAYGDHGKLFSVGEHRFGICTHNRGSKQIKSCYVSEFLKVMINLELL